MCILQVPDFTPNVIDQVKTAQSMYIKLKETAEQEITKSLEQEYHIRKTYDLHPKSQQFFESELNKSLEPRISKIKMLVRDIMDNEKCKCKEIDVSEYISEGGRNLTKCFNGSIKQVTSAIQNIREDIQYLSNDLINRGNTAILHCIDERNIFMPFSITDCYNLNFKVTKLESEKTLKSLRDARTRLDSLLPHLDYNGFTSPCMEEATEYAKLVPDRLEYDYYIACFDNICPGSFGIWRHITTSTTPTTTSTTPTTTSTTPTTTSTTPFTTIYTETPVPTTTPSLEPTTKTEYDYYDTAKPGRYTIDEGGVIGWY